MSLLLVILIFLIIMFVLFFFQILEYIEDLKYYYDNGYGNPIGESMGCPIVKDLIDNFKYDTSAQLRSIIDNTN